MRLNKYLTGSFYLITILLIGAVLRFYKINDLMPFIGDQGWFYLSARDLIVNGEVPLVGIASSHTWLHQGPWWTYLLAPTLLLGNFNPVSGAYLSIVIDLIAIWLMYKAGTELFGEKVGSISGLLYASSPIAIMNSRMPYHTAPIPLFTILFLYSLLQWLKGNIYYFPLALFSLVMLYNFELATVILIPGFITIAIYGIRTRQKWARLLVSKKILLFSLAAFIPMVPVLVYDFSHGFLQTAGFGAWIFYKILTALQVLDAPTVSQQVSFKSMAEYILFFLQRLLFLPYPFIALLIFLLGTGIVVYKTVIISRKKILTPDIVLLFFLILLVSGLLINKTPSEAYLPMLYPAILLIVAIAFAEIVKSRIALYAGYFFMIIMIAFNSYSLLSREYLTGKFGAAPALDVRIKASEDIVRMVKDDDYMVKGVAEGTLFRAYTMNYEYLLWWLGNPVRENSKNIIYVVDGTDSVKIIKRY